MGGRVTRYPMRGSREDRRTASSATSARPSLDGRDERRLFLPVPDRHALDRPASAEGNGVDLCWAYNRWLTEKVLPESGGRFYSMLCLPFSDPEKRCATSRPSATASMSAASW
jgi:hypothetical protein